MSYILDRLDQLLADAQAAVDGSTLPDKGSITVTDDGRKVSTAESLRAGAIIIYPMPVEEWPAPSTGRLSWTIGVVASSDSARDAADRIHALKDLLLDAGVTRWRDRAAPTDFTLPNQGTVPGYTITHIEEHTRRSS
ncbi:hypothetical protein [Microbacterium sp.]|uniref:hypothetical protein n=1 Tax=Actinomycetes TaxID=1760 RepID=UPI0037CBF548